MGIGSRNRVKIRALNKMIRVRNRVRIKGFVPTLLLKGGREGTRHLPSPPAVLEGLVGPLASALDQCPAP